MWGSQLPSRIKDIIMATPKRKKTTLDKDFAKALTDLNKVFSATILGKKFKIKPWKIYYYKRYRKRKPFSKTKRKKILRFYRKLIRRKEREDFRYHYKVTKRKRIEPVRFIAELQVKELIKEIGKEELAKRMKVKPETIERWETRKIGRLKKEHRKKLFRLYETIKRLAGIFFLCYQCPMKWGRRRIMRTYCYIKYYPAYKGTKEGFLNLIREREWETAELEDKWRYLIAPQEEFDISATIDFLRNLDKVSEARLPESLEDCREFIEDNFKGKDRRTLLEELSKYEQ